MAHISIRLMKPTDLYRFENANLDKFTETFAPHFYAVYFTQWPEYNYVAEVDGQLAGYVLGKAEGMGELWHGHVSALTVASEYRRLGVAEQLMEVFEELSESQGCYFVDLFVRPDNERALNFYTKGGYEVFRTVDQYYGAQDDASDMRKVLSRDVKQKSLEGKGHRCHPRDTLF